MKKLSELTAQVLVTQALLENRLVAGRLMSPKEVARATTGRELPYTHAESWYLCGTVPSEFFSTIEFDKLSHIGYSYEGSEGSVYVVWAQQWRHWQHRFVLQMMGHEASEYLAFVQTHKIRFSIAENGGPLAVLIEGDNKLKTTVPANLAVTPVPQDLMQHSAELLWITAKMLAPEAVTDPALPKVRSVCVTVVQTQSVLAALRLQADLKDRAEMH